MYHRAMQTSTLFSNPRAHAEPKFVRARRFPYPYGFESTIEMANLDFRMILWPNHAFEFNDSAEYDCVGKSEPDFDSGG